jgi:hypothetical protein
MRGLRFPGFLNLFQQVEELISLPESLAANIKLGDFLDLVPFSFFHVDLSEKAQLNEVSFRILLIHVLQLGL